MSHPDLTASEKARMMKERYLLRVAFVRRQFLAVECVGSRLAISSPEWKVYDADTVVFNIADPIAATGVSVTPATASLVEGATQQLSAMIEPNDATNKSVTWESSAPANRHHGYPADIRQRRRVGAD